MSTSQSPTRFQVFIHSSANLVLLVGGVLSLAIGLRSAWTGSETLAATTLAAGLILVFAATIDRFESLKGLGMEAKVRHLDQQIAKTNDTLEKLRGLTELAGETILQLQSSIGRHGGAPRPTELLDVADKIKGLLSDVNSDFDTSRRVLQPWVRVFCQDMTLIHLNAIHQKLHERTNELVTKKMLLSSPNPDAGATAQISDIQRQLDEINDFIRGDALKPNVWRLEDYSTNLIAAFETAPKEIQPLLTNHQEAAAPFAKDMGQFCKTMDLPRRNVWISTLEAARG